MLYMLKHIETGCSHYMYIYRSQSRDFSSFIFLFRGSFALWLWMWPVLCGEYTHASKPKWIALQQPLRCERKPTTNYWQYTIVEMDYLIIFRNVKVIFAIFFFHFPQYFRSFSPHNWWIFVHHTHMQRALACYWLFIFSRWNINVFMECVLHRIFDQFFIVVSTARPISSTHTHTTYITQIYKNNFLISAKWKSKMAQSRAATQLRSIEIPKFAGFHGSAMKYTLYYTVNGCHWTTMLTHKSTEEIDRRLKKRDQQLLTQVNEYTINVGRYQRRLTHQLIKRKRKEKQKKKLVTVCVHLFFTVCLLLARKPFTCLVNQQRLLSVDVIKQHAYTPMKHA